MASLEPRTALGGLLAAILLAVPQVAGACFVCFGGEGNDWTPAFVAGTIVMLGLPPAIVLGAGVAIYRSIKRTEAARAEQDRSDPPA